MKLELTNHKAWKKLSERKLSTANKIRVYEKLGGAYRLANNEGEQVFNKLTELLKYAMNEGMLNRNIANFIDAGESVAVSRGGEDLGKWKVTASTNNGATILSQDGNQEIDLKTMNGEYVDMKGNKYQLSKISNEVIYEGDGEDHEVSMSMNQLDDIVRNAMELKGKIGTTEKNLPGWIQDHISQSQNFINQANTGYHELKTK
jgi:hypothetical protein